MCGENPSREKYLPAAVGSPPRVRGKRAARERMLGIQRITPACAGKTVERASDLVADEDHPRVCGENGKTRSRVTSFLGSPPRVRGKLDEKPDGEFKFRITPACAGKTSHFTLRLSASQDHPRVCGENEL